MADLTPLTIIVELLPAVLVTFVYFLFFQKKRNRFIEIFVVLMYVKAIHFFIYYISEIPSVTPFNPVVDSNTLWYILVTDFLFHFAYTLQEYLTWITVSFFSVLFGMLVLMVKLALQDPMKRKFANIIRRITGKEPVTDGFSGLRDRLNNLEFDDIEPQPLNPEMQSKVWRDSWRDYLIIGLATLLPSMSFYIGTASQFALKYTASPAAYQATLPNTYVFGVLILLTWIYRFGYPASNRIAKGAGAKLGDQDVGNEMMRGVLGWFFRLNLLLTIITIILDVLSLPPSLYYILPDYYITGLIEATPPIIFAILILPLAENFSVHLYKRTFDNITKARSKIGSIDWNNTITNMAGAGITGILTTGGIVLAVMGVTLNYTFLNDPPWELYPGLVDGGVNDVLFGAQNNSTLIPGTIWVLLMLAIPLAFALFLGVIGHFVRRGSPGSTEAFAFVTGLIVAVGVWLLLPGLDYILGIFVTETVVGGSSFYRLVPFVNDPSGVDVLFRLAYQFVVNLPFVISAALFTLYYFEFREKMQIEEGKQIGPLLNVEKRDLVDSTVMFVGGLIASFIGVYIVGLVINNPALLYDLILGLIFEIGDANGLEFVFAMNVSTFVLIVEHNIIRTLLMLVIGPIFWSLVLWFVAVKSKTEGENRLAWFSIISVIVGTVLSVVWTISDEIAGVFVSYEPWIFLAELGIRAVLIFGSLIGVYLLVAIVNRVTGRAQNGMWFAILLTLFAIEYFVYDDQFTIIALVVLSFIMAGFYEVTGRGNNFLHSWIKMSLMSLAVAEVLSTALWIGGIASLEFFFGGNIVLYLSSILPHAIIEIPAFLFAAALSIRIARNIGQSVDQEDWESIPRKTRELLTDSRTWRTYVLVVFFLVIAALIETNITQIIVELLFAI